jgi:pantoate--beta-alanine ligase
MKEIAGRARAQNLRLGFVPTMGFMHEGHLSLIRKVNELTDLVVVSIFVNPTQFGPDEDYERYPRDLTRDTDMCIAEGVDYLFVPEAKDLYPPGPRVYVDVADLTETLEGASRPGHFRGVATIVLKLFEIVQPHLAAFGQKDAQQAIVIRRMVEDLLLDVELLVLPIIRDENGLALSSRNRYLSEDERAAAAAVPRALEAARELLAEGRTDPAELVQAATEVIAAEELLTVDYIELVDNKNLQPLSTVDREVLLLIAVNCGKTRLIDNALLAPK